MFAEKRFMDQALARGKALSLYVKNHLIPSLAGNVPEDQEEEKENKTDLENFKNYLEENKEGE